MAKKLLSVWLSLTILIFSSISIYADEVIQGDFFLKNIVAVRQDGRHACVHAACVVFQGNLADFHSRHIGHGIEFAGGQYADMDAVTADSVIGHLDSSSSRLMI